MSRAARVDYLPMGGGERNGIPMGVLGTVKKGMFGRPEPGEPDILGSGGIALKPGIFGRKGNGEGSFGLVGIVGLLVPGTFGIVGTPGMGGKNGS